MKNIKYSGETFVIRIPKNYAFDFDKVNSLEDLKNVIQILFAGLQIKISEDCEFVDEIREYLVEIH